MEYFHLSCKALEPMIEDCPLFEKNAHAKATVQLAIEDMLQSLTGQLH